MFDLKFRITRRGAWTHHLSKHYKGKFTSHITFSLDKTKTSDILHIEQADDKQFKNIISFLRRHSIVYKLDIMYRDSTNLYLQIFSDVSKIKSLIGTVNKYGGFITRSIPLIKGDEIWTVTIPNKDQLNDMVNEIKECGDVKILYIKKSSIDNMNLSPMQKKVILFAKEWGYYRFPRKISAQEIAKRLKLSKATLLQHLRIAEAKIISENYLS